MRHENDRNCESAQSFFLIVYFLVAMKSLTQHTEMFTSRVVTSTCIFAVHPLVPRRVSFIVCPTSLTKTYQMYACQCLPRIRPSSIFCLSVSEARGTHQSHAQYISVMPTHIIAYKLSRTVLVFFLTAGWYWRAPHLL